MTQKNITDKLRSEYTKSLAKFLAKEYDVDVCQTAAGTLMIPAVDDNGDGRWIKFNIIIPKEAEEENGNDGYSLATEYQMKLDARAARKAELERKSAEAAAKRKTKAKSN